MTHCSITFLGTTDEGEDNICSFYSSNLMHIHLSSVRTAVTKS